MSDMSDLIAGLAHPPRTTTQVARWVLRFIARESLQPGDRLPSEHDLARSTGAGRSSVREALQLLVGQGLVEVRPGKGYFLRRTEQGARDPTVEGALGMEEIQDLTEARVAIEGACAALAALRATPADAARIEAFLSAMEAKASSASSVYLDALTLHLMIAEAAHNRTLSEILRVIIPKIGAYGAKIAAEIPDHAPMDAALHRELWEKIRTGDPDVARAAMEAHIRDAASLYRLPYESRAIHETSVPPHNAEPPSPPRSTRRRRGSS